jgi:phosphatidate cytidylyltransferase
MLASLAALGLGAMELVNLLGGTTARPSGNTVLAGVFALVLANWAPHVARVLARSDGGLMPPASYNPMGMVEVMAWPLWTFVAVLMALFVSQGIQFRRPGATMATMGGSMLAIAYVGLMGGFIIQMRWFDHGIIPLAALVATAKGSDVGAYTFGRILGKHKLWPKLSPNKTIEGAVGGLVFGVAASLIVTLVAKSLLHVPALDWLPALGYGLLISPMAQLGDLMESMIKRDCARKDASSAMPGYGGVLDVLDSLLFAAPVAYGYWLWLGP